MVRSKSITLLVALAMVAMLTGEVATAAFDGCCNEEWAGPSMTASEDHDDAPCHNCICVGTALLSTAPTIARHGVSTSTSTSFLLAPDAPVAEIFLPPRLL